MSQQPTYKRLKQAIFAAVIGLLFLPMIQHKFRFFEEKPLNGSFTLSTKPPLNKENWFSGNYQEGQDKYITEHTGFRPGWVRFYNQWNYNLFRKVSTNAVIVGKEAYLYEENYIKAYYGLDFIGDEAIAEVTYKLKAVQDTLARKGITLSVILAPGKGSYVPEYIPERYRQKRGKTNYDGYVKTFGKQDVRYIDMHHWFESMKKTTRHPLFSKTGIHWTVYGQYFAMDSMTKYVSSVCRYPIPRFVLDRIDVSDSTQMDDDDIEKGMNLMRDIPDLQLAYPKFHPNRNPRKEDPKVLVISDSFYWGLFNANASHSLFNDGEFWYYNEQIYPASFTTETLVKKQDLNKKLEENKVVFIICTDANLYRLGFGFIERAYQTYYPKK